MKLNKIYSTAIVVALMSLTFSLNASAEEGHIGMDLSLSNETGNFGVYSLRERADEITNIGAEFFFNEPGDRFVDVFGSVTRKGLADGNLEMGVKGKVFFVNQSRKDQVGTGLMLGVTGRYWIPTEIPVSIAADILYNPPIVAFSDVNSAFVFETKVEFRILPSTVAYIGFRGLTVDFDQEKDHELDKNMHVGVNIAFQ